MPRSDNNLSRLSGTLTICSFPSFLDYTPMPQVASFEIARTHSLLSTTITSGLIVLDMKAGDGSFGEVDFTSLNEFIVRYVAEGRRKLFVS